jgi:hypothetical protein
VEDIEKLSSLMNEFLKIKIVKIHLEEKEILQKKCEINKLQKFQFFV